MKIAVSGKGGSGKTLFVASLAIIFSQKNKVYAIDADPDGNLGITLGFTQQELMNLRPICELKDIIEERTQAKQRTGFYILNPEVSD
ncbi:MAG: AAA family ATPase, partial [Elusimicrobiota bacterium]|nr:AAA family ATPase [Elusimicrobiota bacterium]